MGGFPRVRAPSENDRVSACIDRIRLPSHGLNPRCVAFDLRAKSAGAVFFPLKFERREGEERTTRVIAVLLTLLVGVVDPGRVATHEKSIRYGAACCALSLVSVVVVWCHVVSFPSPAAQSIPVDMRRRSA